MMSPQTLNGNQPSKKNPRKTLETLQLQSTFVACAAIMGRQPKTSTLTLKSHTVTCHNHLRRSQQQDPKPEKLLNQPRDPSKTTNQKDKD
jgi:hypothetical protein